MESDKSSSGVTLLCRTKMEMRLLLWYPLQWYPTLQMSTRPLSQTITTHTPQTLALLLSPNTTTLPPQILAHPLSLTPGILPLQTLDSPVTQTG